MANAEFNVSRVISYQNPFLPQIKGSVLNDGRDTKIEVTMRLKTFILAFMVAWLGGVLLFGGVMLNDITSSGLDLFTLIPIIMLAIGVLIFTIPFKLESRISKKYLKSLFEAEIL